MASSDLGSPDGMRNRSQESSAYQSDETRELDPCREESRMLTAI